MSGIARITIDGTTKDYGAGETVLIPLGAKHRMANPEDDKDMILIEVQTGTYFGEDDIVRVEDDYDRPESHEVINLWKPNGTLLKMKKVAISGYFDPIHIGHLEYIKMARELGDYLIVIVNNDKQAYLKKVNLLCAKMIV